MKTQEDFIREILEIKTAHPEYEIHFMLFYNQTNGIDEHIPVVYRIFSVKVCPFYVSSDGSEVFDYEQGIRNYMRGELCGQENIEALVNEWYKKEVKNAIIVNIEAEYQEEME